MKKKTENNLTRTRKKYQKPEIIYSKEIEVLAAICPSGYSGLPGCRYEGLGCETPWE